MTNCDVVAKLKEKKKMMTYRKKKKKEKMDTNLSWWQKKNAEN